MTENAEIVEHHLGRKEGGKLLEAAEPGRIAGLDAQQTANDAPRVPKIGQTTSATTSVSRTMLTKLREFMGGYQPGTVSNNVRKKMRRDGIVNLALSIISAPVVKRILNTEPVCPESPEIAAFAKDLWDKRLRFGFVRDAMGILPFGHAPFEKVWERKDISFSYEEGAQTEGEKARWIEKTIKDAWTYRRLKAVPPDTVAYLLGDIGPYKDELAGFRQGTGVDTVDVLVRDRKMAKVTHDEEYGNPYGFAHMDYGYNTWYYRGFTRLFMLRYYERAGGPTLKGRAPSGEEGIQYTAGADGESKTSTSTENLEAMASKLDALRSNGIIVLSSERDAEGNHIEDAEFMEDSKRGEQWIALQDHFTMMQLLDLLVPGVYRARQTGTYAEQQVLQDVCLWLTNLVLYEVILAVNDLRTGIFADPVQLNYGLDAPIPTLPFVEIPVRNVEAATALIRAIASIEKEMWKESGKPIDAYNSLMYRVGLPDLLAQMGFPARSEEEVEALLPKSDRPTEITDDKKSKPVREMAVTDKELINTRVTMTEVDAYIKERLTNYEETLDARSAPLYSQIQRAENDVKAAGRTLLEAAAENMTVEGNVNPDKIKGPLRAFMARTDKFGKRMEDSLTGVTPRRGTADDSTVMKFVESAGRLAASDAKGLLKLYGDKVPEGIKNLAAGNFAENYDDNAWGLWRNIENLVTRDIGKYQEAVRNAVRHSVPLSVGASTTAQASRQAALAAGRSGASTQEATALAADLRAVGLTGQAAEDAKKIRATVAAWSAKIPGPRRLPTAAQTNIVAKATAVTAPDVDRTLKHIVEGWTFPPTYVKDTVEAHHRATYRRGLFEVGSLGGYMLWKMYESPKAKPGDHTEKDARNVGKIKTAEKWTAGGYDLKQFGGEHHGSRMSWWFVPMALIPPDEREE